MKKRFLSMLTVISAMLFVFIGCTQPTESPSEEPEVKTFTISFDSNGGTEVSSQTVKDGEKAIKPENPTKDGFLFFKWYNGDSVYDFETPVHSNLKLKAEWINPEVKTFTISFDSNGGTEVSSQIVKDGEKATRPENPTKDGFLFSEWYNGDSVYDFENPVNSNLELKAEWIEPEVKTFTISFDSNGGTEVSSQIVKDGEKVTKPENPTKDGFLFLEWYNGNSVYDFETPVHSNLELNAEWIDPDYNNLGNVDSVSFVISDIPEEIPSIYIYRKYNTDAEFSFYGNYYFYTAKERTLTFKDDFVDPGKTYQYKYSYKTPDKETVTVFVNNGKTKNFTPSSGVGELKFVEPIPECTYNQKTTELTFENKLELSVVPETYYKALLISDNDNWLTITCPFGDTIFNLKEMFSHGKGKYNINNFGPAVNWTNFDYENNDNYALWILGKKYDIADKDIKLYFPSGLEAENVENGIKVYATREDYEWKNSEIEIFEDDVKIDCYFYINNVWSIKQRGSISFVYPFVTAGKKYTFKFSPYEGKDYEVTVTADKTSSLQIDKNKLKENFYNAKLSYIENDTESKPSRLIKLSKDAKNIFIGKTDSILQYNEYLVTMYVQNIESSWSGEIREYNDEYDRLLSSGLDILEPAILTNEWWKTKYTVSSANKGKEIFFRPYLQISVDEKEYASGALVFVGEDSDLFNWTEVDETLFE